MLTILLCCCFFICSLAWPAKLAHYWVGGADGLVTVDFNQWSSTFGQVLQTVSVPSGPTRKTAGNLPHHIGISSKGDWIVAGGLLSFFVHVPSACGGPLSGGDANGGNRDDVFLFSVGSNGMPSFHSSYNLPGGCTDEFHPTGNSGEWIISQMCDDVGNSPGGLYLFNVPSSTNGYATFSQWGWKSSGVTFGFTDGFNPHGGDYSSWYGFVIGDYVWPASLLNYNTRSYLDAYCGESLSNSALTFRNTVRFFNNNGILSNTYTLPGWGYMAAAWLANHFAISAGGVPTYLGGDNSLYLIDTTCTQSLPGTTCYTKAYDYAATYGGAFSVGIPFVDKVNRRVLMAYGMRWAVMLSYNVVNGVVQTPFTKVWDHDFGVIPGAQDDQYPWNNTRGTHYLKVENDLYSWGGRFVFINSFADFPVNNANGGLQYECANSPGSGPLGTAWPNCPASVDSGVATFFCNFHGDRTANVFTFGSNGTPTLTSTQTFNGATPHSVALAQVWGDD